MPGKKWLFTGRKSRRHWSSLAFLCSETYVPDWASEIWDGKRPEEQWLMSGRMVKIVIYDCYFPSRSLKPPVVCPNYSPRFFCLLPCYRLHAEQKALCERLQWSPLCMKNWERGSAMEAVPGTYKCFFSENAHQCFVSDTLRILRTVRVLSTILSMGKCAMVCICWQNLSFFCRDLWSCVSVGFIFNFLIKNLQEITYHGFLRSMSTALCLFAR